MTPQTRNFFAVYRGAEQTVGMQRCVTPCVHGVSQRPQINLAMMVPWQG